MLAIAFALGHATGEQHQKASGEPSLIDIGFSQDMAVHHDQAVLMASLASTRATGGVKAMAAAILVNQSRETGIMRGWLQLWEEPQQATEMMSWMHGSSMSDHSMDMPGMASTAEIEGLWGASETEFDVRFLQLMIRHHQGGIQMARFAGKNASIPAVRDLALLMVVGQTEEIVKMSALLRTLGGEPLRAP